MTIVLTLGMGLLAVTLVLLFVLQRNESRSLRDLLQAQTYTVIGSAIVTPRGKVVASPQIGDPRFAVPLSGWYWAIAKASDPARPLVHSRSISGESLPVPPRKNAAFDDRFQRYWRVSENGYDGQQLDAQIYLGEDGELYQISIGGTLADMVAERNALVRTIVIMFLALMAGTLLFTWIAVRRGLLPLTNARAALAAMRAGEQVTLLGPLPPEIAPLAEEINALAAANKATMEKARHQVGNLAHALKTPLSAAINDAREIDGGDKIVGQLNAIQQQISVYLEKARRGAKRSGAVHRTDVEPVLMALKRVMEKLHPHLYFRLEVASAPLWVQCDEDDLQESVGNLLDNAARFSNRHVSLSAAPYEDDQTQVMIVVEDDGPGLDAEEREAVIVRGKRLDEANPGSGLGLAIVSEMVDDYGGSLRLNRSETFGGLRCAIVLPRIANRGADQ